MKKFLRKHLFNVIFKNSTAQPKLVLVDTYIHTYNISYERKFTAFRSVSLSGGFLTPPTTGDEGRQHVYEHNISILFPITAIVYVYTQRRRSSCLQTATVHAIRLCSF